MSGKSGGGWTRRDCVEDSGGSGAFGGQHRMLLLGGE